MLIRCQSLKHHYHHQLGGSSSLSVAEGLLTVQQGAVGLYSYVWIAYMECGGKLCDMLYVMPRAALLVVQLSV